LWSSLDLRTGNGSKSESGSATPMLNQRLGNIWYRNPGMVKRGFILTRAVLV